MRRSDTNLIQGLPPAIAPVFDLDPEEPLVEDGGRLEDDWVLEGLIKEVLEGGTETVEGTCAVLSGWSKRNDVSVEVEGGGNILAAATAATGLKTSVPVTART
jgi:hypothetical protein